MEEQFKQHPKHKEYQVGNLGTIYKNGEVFRNAKRKSAIWLDGKTITVQELIDSLFNAKPIQPITKKEKPVKSTIQNEIKDNWLAGRTLSNEHKLNISKSLKGAKHPKFKGYYIVNGIEYDSLNVIAELLNLNPKTIYKRCKANKNGYSFKPLPTIATQ